MASKTIRETVTRLISAAGDIDAVCDVKIVRRGGPDNAVVQVAVVPISYFDAMDNICIEETDIMWGAPYI